MSIWDGLPRMQIPMFTELIAMVLKEISMRLLAQTTPGSKLQLLSKCLKLSSICLEKGLVRTLKNTLCLN
ncbi:unnamed protein product [Brassica oleracea var. botrytis]